MIHERFRVFVRAVMRPGIVLNGSFSVGENHFHTLSEKVGFMNARYPLCRRRIAWLGAAGMWWATAAGGQTIHLQGDSFIVRIEPDRAYTVTYVEYGGSVLVNALACGSCQGSVIYVGAGWFGTCHGGETVEFVSLAADGSPWPLTGGTCRASAFRLVKRSFLGSHMRLDSESVFSCASIRERATLTVLAPGVNPSVIYPFLSTHGNNLTLAMTAGAGGAPTVVETSRDDDSFVQLGSAAVLAQYDPIAGVGISTRFGLSAVPASSVFIWDRTCDNKLYWSVPGCTGWQSEGMSWTFETRRFPFRAALSEWISVGMNPLPADFDRDGDVDRNDLEMFESCATGAAISAVPPSCCLPPLEGRSAADLDGDGDADQEDFGLFQRAYTGTMD